MSTFQPLLPDGVVVVEAEAGLEPDRLYPEEETAIARAIDKRRREFALGRHCAREALRRLGADAGPIPVGPDRGPLWPAGIAGSITHCEGLVAAAVGWADAHAGIGIDAEPAGRIEPRLARLICTPAEEARNARLTPPAAADWLAITFCAKEAVHKAVAPASGVTMGFRDVELDLDPAGRFTVRRVAPPDERVPDLARVEGRWSVDRGLVLAAAILRTS